MTVLFGLLGLYLTLRSRYPGEISFVREQTIALFDEIVKNVPDLAVLYKDNPVSANVVMVRGAFVNTGKKDIAPGMVEKPLTMKLPEGARWLSTSVVSYSPDVKAKVEVVAENALELSGGLFRRKEYVRFQALAEMGPPSPNGSKDSAEKRVEKSLTFQHRIQDTRPVKAIELRGTEKLKPRIKREAILLGLAAVVVAVVSILALHDGIGYVLAYQFDTGRGRAAEVAISGVRVDSVSVRALGGGYRATMPLGEFLSRREGVPTIERDRTAYLLFAVAPFLYVLALGAPLLLRLREYRTQRRLMQFLGVDLEGQPAAAPTPQPKDPPAGGGDIDV